MEDGTEHKVLNTKKDFDDFLYKTAILGVPGNIRL
jgi:hypothetical protein